MYFCNDVDLMAWEPTLFNEATFSHQTILRASPCTLTGTTLTLSSGAFDNVQPGMIAAISASVTQNVEILQITDSTHAVVSILRGRSDESAIAPSITGSATASVTTFRPQIAAVGDELLARLGVRSSRDFTPQPTSCGLIGFKSATIFGTLAALYRTLVDAKTTDNTVFSKYTFYSGLAQASRETLSGMIDKNGDGLPDTQVFSAVPQLVRV